MSNPTVDIIVPNFNKGVFLDECISSILKQSYSNWKLYIIDDCSSDNSAKIINKYADNEKINIVILKKNKGPSFCRNLGIRISDAKYIAFFTRQERDNRCVSTVNRQCHPCIF